tara:strand:- start:2 stop:1216 length:1215 start_codon:yes stop_codon:yes gene_type:complete
MFRKTIVGLVLLSIAFVVEAQPNLEEMWKLIQKQQAEISTLKDGLAENDAKDESTFTAIEEITSGPTAKLAEWASKTSMGGYGELHYNNHNSDNSTNSKNEFDLHRFVLFVGHQYNDNLRFFSEFEIEHSIAGEGKAGEVEVEQAYIEWDYADNHRAKGGVFLMPVGILNETHEPDSFYGTERNAIEKNIIPSTWWEGGVMLSGELAEGLSYDAGAHSGLYINASEGKYKIRDGRQKVGKAKGDDIAYTGRLKYTGIPGLELAATFQHQVDVWQGETVGGVDKVDANLIEAHAAYKNGPFGFRALYAQWDLDDGINTIQAGADEQEGFYIEPSYQLTDKLGVFSRFNQYDNTAGGNTNSEKQQTDIGFNYWIHEQVVLKVDYFDQDNDSGTEYKGFNAGIGWSF